jgi:hypothetical protein
LVVGKHLRHTTGTAVLIQVTLGLASCKTVSTENAEMTLPYKFDSSGVVSTILRGVLGLLALVIVPGILYSLFVSHSTAAAVQLLLVAALVAWFGSIFLRNLVGSRGTITADAVVVERVPLFAFRLAGPEGRFAVGQFQAVRVERAPAPMFAQGGPHARVILAGKAGVPDILIARADPEGGRALGAELAAALGLPCQERQEPY